MATLLLPEIDRFSSERPTEASPSLRSWLKDDWAILFSHPDDFVPCEFEQDRWLGIVQRAFAQRQARPLALTRPAQQLDAGWVTRVTGDARALLLDDTSVFFKLHARRLRESIAAAGNRFVMIVDSTLVRRKTYSYSDPTGLPSPLDFLAWLAGLRARRERSPVARECGAIQESAPVVFRPPARIASITA